MKYYNLYIKPSSNSFQTLKDSYSKPYISEIAFINTLIPIISKKIFYIKYYDSKKNDYYQDYNNYLSNVYFSRLKNDNKFPNNEINEISYCNFNYSYVKIIKDIQNPQLEGETMLFKFGNRIKNKINEYFIKNNSQFFSNIFEINVTYTNIYLNFDNCHFLEEKIVLTDNSLDLNNEIKIKFFMNKKVERNEKIKKINNFNLLT
jgi:hypothetical protein